MMLDCVRHISVDIWWHVERCVCGWSSCLSRLTSLFTLVTFSSVCACFGLPLSCLLLVLSVSEISFSKVYSPSLLQLIFEKSLSILHEAYPWNWYKFSISALSSLLNGVFHCQYFVTALQLLFTTISTAFVYKHWKHTQNDAPLCMKISRKVFQKVSFAYIFILIIVILKICVARGSVVTRLRCGAKIVHRVCQ